MPNNIKVLSALLIILFLSALAAKPKTKLKQWVNLRVENNPAGLLGSFYQTTKDEAPLVVLLPGCMPSANTFAYKSGWVDLAERHGFNLLLAEQRLINNPSRCFNWFKRRDFSKTSGEVGSLFGMIDHCLKTWPSNQPRVYLYGISAGAAMAMNLTVLDPERFEAVAMLAGPPFHKEMDFMKAIDLALSPDVTPVEKLRSDALSFCDSTARFPQVYCNARSTRYSGGLSVFIRTNQTIKGHTPCGSSFR
jgi:poly(hydroxyalkanoate) depolymerase family esterase